MQPILLLTPNYKTSFFVILISTIIVSQACLAQISNTEVVQIKYLYDELEFEKAISAGGKALKSGKLFTPDELTFLHRYMALSFYNFGQQDSARVHFLSLLSMRPGIQLDAGEISPKIIEFFNNIKQDYKSLIGNSNNISFARYVLVKDRRHNAVWRSALVPGWGQFYKGQKTRGLILGAGFWGSLTSAIIAAINEDDHKKKYVASTQPAEISSNYSTYNTWFKRRRILTFVTIAFWAIVVGDANLTASTQPTVALDQRGNIQFAMQIRLP